MIDLMDQQIIPTALSLLPHRMDRPGAHEMLLAIGLQESRFEHRRQVGGPARGFWQFERNGVHGVLTHDAVRHHAEGVLDLMRYRHQGNLDARLDQAHAAIEHNDILACVFARLLLWTVPGPLPGQSEPDVAWDQYTWAWRPGKPHRQTWDVFYEQAWGAG